MAKKKRGNDAIPTWSGFNYQGKITLLCLLIEINKMLIHSYDINNISDDCYVEIEKTEDFVIFIKGKVKALYQVKAYLSTNKADSFFNANKNLIDHRSNLNALTADCYLCVPLAISGWNDKGNIYRNQINLFFYDSKPVHVTKVAEKIKAELDKSLKHMRLPNENLDDIYLGLCSFLDEKVSEMHKQGAKKRNYNILFREIAEFIYRANTEYVIKQEAREKENIYNHIVENFKEIVDEFCNNECESKKMGTCKKDIYGCCALTTSYDYILEINIWEYCKYLNPHIVTGWEKQLSYVERLREDDFKKLLIPVLHQISNDILCRNSEILYCETDIFGTIENKVIPTLLNFDFGLNDVEKSISNTLNKIKQNSFLWSSSIVGGTITADTKGEVYNTEEDSILYFQKSEDDITDNNSYLKIIDSRDFIKKVKGEE